MKNGFVVTEDIICNEIPEGSEPKFFIKYNGRKYLVKDSSYNEHRKRNSLAPFCEYVLSKKAELATSDIENYKSYFWYMFLFDAILGNRDRHAGNWGFIATESGIEFSPIFDNGSSLFPDVDLSDWNHYDFIKDRVFRIPASQLKMWRPGEPERPFKTNFYEIIRDYHDEFASELNVIAALDFDKIMLDSLKDVPAEYAVWFKTIAKFRFECLIKLRDFDLVWEEYLNDFN